MSDFAEDLARKAITLGHFTALGTDAFVGSKAVIPKGAGPYGHFIDTPGAGTVERHDRVGDPYVMAMAQVIVRGRNAAECRVKAGQLFAAFVGLRNVVLVPGNSTYLWCRPRQFPFDLQTDEPGRARIVFNIEGMKTL
jgi:hypothetical protein